MGAKEEAPKGGPPAESSAARRIIGCVLLLTGAGVFGLGFGAPPASAWDIPLMVAGGVVAAGGMWVSGFVNIIASR